MSKSFSKDLAARLAWTIEIKSSENRDKKIEALNHELQKVARTLFSKQQRTTLDRFLRSSFELTDTDARVDKFAVSVRHVKRYMGAIVGGSQLIPIILSVFAIR